MPIFEYRCPDGHVAERLVGSSGEAKTMCRCGKPATRIMSVPAKRTDGIYSHTPNIGDPDKFEEWSGE